MYSIPGGLQRASLHSLNVAYNGYFLFTNLIVPSNRVAAGFLSSGSKRVRVLQQDVETLIEGDLARVEVHEVYESTNQQHEIAYFFTFPVTSTVTGLWTSDSENATRVSGTVVPRGAAQKVYTEQRKKRKRDPALIEEIGDGQYRLRLLTRNDDTSLHVWFSFVTVADGSMWHFPTLTERHNVYWDFETVRTIDGVLHSSLFRLNSDWLTAGVTSATVLESSSSYIATFADVQLIVEAIPNVQRMSDLSKNEEEIGLELSIGVIIDRTLAMQDSKENLVEAIKELRRHSTDVHVYLAASEFWSMAMEVVEDFGAFNPNTLAFFGGQSLQSILKQFSQKRLKDYDCVILLTNQANMEMEDSKESQIPIDLHSPLFVVHTGNGAPSGYPDSVADLIQSSGGKVVDDMIDIFSYLRAMQEAPSNMDTITVEGNFIWTAKPFSGNSTSNESALFRPLGAKQLIAYLAQKSASLDVLHSVAMDAGIVTAYSSITVVQGDTGLLETMSNNKDRFNREVEEFGNAVENSVATTTSASESSWTWYNSASNLQHVWTTTLLMLCFTWTRLWIQ